ncbi:hypothetical protein [Mycobacterium sp. TY813]|uniref:hypothetical protein n=1 Tax=Mycobacterium TaxID=1763 RepID=UPI002741F431|nr:hypothetical protein [Mycobacterium sp. TY813]MDP7732945.1 hypothetical protein [Mycobacterium sp. TY813]
MPANIFDDQRRAWIAAHAGVFLFQKRRAELLAKTIRARTRAQVGARPDPHDDQITAPLIFRSTSTTTGSYEAALVAVCALLAPLGWAAGKAAYLALVTLIPERLRAYPIPALFWSAAASATPLVLFYDPAPGLTDTLVLPWLLAQLPAAFAAAALYGLAEGWLAVDGSSDWWPLTPLVGDVDDDLILDSTILPMPTVLDDAPTPPRRRIPPSIGTRRRTPPTVSWRPIISGITALTIVTLWYVWIVADTTLDPPRIAPVHGNVHATF